MIRTTLTLLFLLTTVAVFPCAVDPGPFFKPQSQPEDQAAFNAGKIGLLTPALSKENELIAFRLLSGLKMTPPPPESSSFDNRDVDVLGNPNPGFQAWRAARTANGFVGTPPHGDLAFPPATPQSLSFTNYRVDNTSSQFVFFQNCLDSAFETAIATLLDRRTHYASPADFSAWVLAQDQVFSNCSNTQASYPSELPASAPAMVRADRAYQIAAAHFYAEDFDEAERRFRAIASDPQSPWRQIGAYMIARTYLREVSLQKNAAAAPLARQQLTLVSHDTSAPNLAESARGLLLHLDAIDHPAAVLEPLSKQLLAPQPTPALTATLSQCVYVMTVKSFEPAMAQPDVAEPFDWVRSLERGYTLPLAAAEPQSAIPQRIPQHILDRWKSRHTLPWLTLALMYASGKDQVAPELIAAADHLPPDSPAFGTASYNAIRLRMERDETDGARQQLDALLSKSSDDEPDSLVNAWRAERMRLATSFDDLLHWAPRTPLDTSDDDADQSADSQVFGDDATYFLNFSTPLAKLAAAAHSNLVPAWSASDIALATWTRAFMLNNTAALGSVAPNVAKAHPDWPAADLTPATGTAAAAWRFRAALLIALHHEFSNVIPVDYRRHVNSGDWFCEAAAPGQQTNTPGIYNATPEVAWQLPTAFQPPDAVLSPSESATARRELAALQKLGGAQSFLAPIIFDWAQSHPDDPLVPQALHRLVVVVRYGCQTFALYDPNNKAAAQTPNALISKRAFDLLHTRYPQSPWTAQTPYWFK